MWQILNIVKMYYDLLRDFALKGNNSWAPWEPSSRWGQEEGTVPCWSGRDNTDQMTRERGHMPFQLETDWLGPQPCADNGHVLVILVFIGDFMTKVNQFFCKHLSWHLLDFSMGSCFRSHKVDCLEIITLIFVASLNIQHFWVANGRPYYTN